MDKLFLDANIFIAAAGSSTGGSRAIFDLAEHSKLLAVSSVYAIKEARINIERKLGKQYLPLFYVLVSHLQDVQKQSSELTLNQHYSKLIVNKDLPILVGANLQKVHYLITLDKKDFRTTILQAAELPFKIMLPGEYLQSL